MTKLLGVVLVAAATAASNPSLTFSEKGSELGSMAATQTELKIQFKGDDRVVMDDRCTTITGCFESASVKALQENVATMKESITALEESVEKLTSQVAPTANNCYDLKVQGKTTGYYKIGDKQVYCEMDIAGGGWTGVWKHAYGEVCGWTNCNHERYRTYSNTYTPCAPGSKYCNLPNKRQYGDVEMMIAGYHNGDLKYAYSGGFNSQIDSAWQGTNFVPKHSYTKHVDSCRNSNGTPPEPVNPSQSYAVSGVTFDKANYARHTGNCETDRYSYGSSQDCRWENCNPNGIGYHKQQTYWIFVRGNKPTKKSDDATCADSGLGYSTAHTLSDGKTTFCEQTIAGGGWTMVWKHAYGEVCGWSNCNNAKYATYSQTYKPCHPENKWCNLPNKRSYVRQNRMMIVAYHNGQVQYAYEGGFNSQIDSAWQGTEFVPKHSYTKHVDSCHHSNGTPPEPVNPSQSYAVSGVTFDKANYGRNTGNCDTDRYRSGSSQDCRWENCNPNGIGYHKQMTLAIYVK